MKIDQAEVDNVQAAELAYVSREEWHKCRNLISEVLGRAIKDASGRVSAYIGDVAEHNGVKSKVFYETRRVHGKPVTSLKKDYERLEEEYRRYLIKDAQDWLASDSQEIFSFVWICHYLDLDPATVRSQIDHQSKKRRHLKAPRPHH